MKEDGIETLIHYPIPPHLSGAFAKDATWGPQPIAEQAAQTHLSLPMGPHLSLEAVDRVTECLLQAIPAE
jgi:dTDP-3-amino-3,4,6-trideoxy-alpha-D-glucose transaminase